MGILMDHIFTIGCEVKTRCIWHTWDKSSSDIPSNIKPIGNKWVYKIKPKPNESIEMYKARLVDKGYNHNKGHNFLIH